MSAFRRRYPVGAEPQADGTTHFRVWAPDPHEVSLVIHGARGARVQALQRDSSGYYEAHVDDVRPGDTYHYRLDGDLVADPASRFQPDGVFGPSQVVDPRSFAWGDTAWSGIALEDHVFSEIHIGTFTPEGTWRSAMERLPDLARAGITAVEVMPVAEFPGRFGWGYDGVFPYAPTRLYGTPDDLRAFVARAHQLGLAVVLDVVYNHLGPDGCVFRRYASAYYADAARATEWGEALNFDGATSGPSREFWAANAAYWIDEFHLDGLRLDATQSIHDTSDPHIVRVMADHARAAAGQRRIVLVAENEPQDTRLVRPASEGGYGLDGLWNDDFHHSAVVALTGRREAYYSDHHGTPQELISAAKYGYLFQGQRYAWQKQRRGTPARGIARSRFVNYLENHDQIANGGDGSRLRLRTTPGRFRAMTALLLLLPGTPLLFQGQEFGSTAPFLFFADHRPELAPAVREGRAAFCAQFASLATPAAQAQLPVPDDPRTFERCRLDWSEQERHRPIWQMHVDLIAMRRDDRAFRAPEVMLDGAVIDANAFVLRYAMPDAEDDRLLVINLGSDLTVASLAEPLVAPPDGCTWAMHWSSEDPGYGGLGSPAIVDDSGWRIPGHSATVLRPWKDG